ncbi:D-alanine--D-alanine ligase family protein [Desulfotignum phosphitoxidans]|uniref:D-alanine--D-alanine ligase DdlB n=1 Tax=Desulfotignum phosphitoxidans DSM 13687 TaxID=1286635 RepID=S0G5Y4_9BACT|nr:D-alanine--D-alanine ligase DdlB [Desulfotignum phosphitoxidans]EMS79711.1 D-alanine--D-alanine ligase DdlB [Desulfotignum phosphitoxidans DSM 13687]
MNRCIAVVHNAVTDPTRPDEADVLVQVDAVSRALTGLGYDPVPVPCDLNLAALKKKLADIQPLGVFNLVESLENRGSLIHVVPTLLDALGIPYTGCPATAVYTTSHKVMAKERLHLAGLPTPAWINPFPLDMPWQGAMAIENSRPGSTESPGSHPTGSESIETGDTGTGMALQKGSPSPLWIIKSVWEHGSLGLETENLVTGTAKTVARLLKTRATGLGGACFAEQFISGREFNLSLLAGRSGVQILPPAEILFPDIPADQPAMVGFRAKWESDSKEYHTTPRRFDFPPGDTPLLEEMETLARRCWHLFHLAGYARVDFRVTPDGRPFVLEVNTNPCLSPDAGFAAALDRAELSYADAVHQMVTTQLCSE